MRSILELWLLRLRAMQMIHSSWVRGGCLTMYWCILSRHQSRVHRPQSIVLCQRRQGGRQGSITGMPSGKTKCELEETRCKLCSGLSVWFRSTFPLNIQGDQPNECVLTFKLRACELPTSLSVFCPALSFKRKYPWLNFCNCEFHYEQQHKIT